MKISQSLLPEFDMEMANMRKVLERVPEDRFDWKPHDKSMTFCGLITHTINIPHWGAVTMKAPHFDIAPEGGEPMQEKPVPSMETALSRFDENVAGFRTALESTSDGEFMESWSLMAGGKAIFTLPRIAVYRGMLMNHMIHHRAQLTVYLRMNDIPIPAIYGPSADEQK